MLFKFNRLQVLADPMKLFSSSWIFIGFILYIDKYKVLDQKNLVVHSFKFWRTFFLIFNETYFFKVDHQTKKGAYWAFAY